MRRLSLLATLSLVAMLVFASAAFAQSRGPSGADGSYNCEDFDTQEEAQEFFDADPSDPDGLDGPPGDAFTGESGVACEGLPSGGGDNGGTTPPDEEPTPTVPEQPQQPQGDLDCIDFATQQAAQANLNANPSDPNGLDADNDGVACEESTNGATTGTGYEDGSGLTNGGDMAEDNTTGGQATTGDQYTDDTAGDSVAGGDDVAELPDTGGPALLLPVAALLMIAGGLSLAVLRRRQ